MMMQGSGMATGLPLMVVMCHSYASPMWPKRYCSISRSASCSDPAACTEAASCTGSASCAFRAGADTANASSSNDMSLRAFILFFLDANGYLVGKDLHHAA